MGEQSDFGIFTSDFQFIISIQSIVILQKIYESVFDIDLVVGLLLERNSHQYTGPVARYILEEQFYRFRYGDRFFYSHENNPYPFTEGMIISRYG